MTKEVTRYECKNPACSLGSRKEPGIFTGGITPEMLNVLTGAPVESHMPEDEGKTWGEGVCPNCGEKGHKLDEPHVIIEGHDPLQPVHDKVANRVKDASDGLTADAAQSEIEAAAATLKDDKLPRKIVSERGNDANPDA